MAEKNSTGSEAVLGQKWDRCVSDTLIKIGKYMWNVFLFELTSKYTAITAFVWVFCVASSAPAEFSLTLALGFRRSQ